MSKLTLVASVIVVTACTTPTTGFFEVSTIGVDPVVIAPNGHHTMRGAPLNVLCAQLGRSACDEQCFTESEAWLQCMLDFQVVCTAEATSASIEFPLDHLWPYAECAQALNVQPCGSDIIDLPEACTSLLGGAS